jgi:hypothetical protein
LCLCLGEWSQVEVITLQVTNDKANDSYSVREPKDL